VLCGFAPWREIIEGSDEDGITRIVNGLEDDDHVKPPGRKEV
jgi:hypothetical protein